MAEQIASFLNGPILQRGISSIGGNLRSWANSDEEHHVTLRGRLPRWLILTLFGALGLSLIAIPELFEWGKWWVAIKVAIEGAGVACFTATIFGVYNRSMDQIGFIKGCVQRDH